MYSKSVRRTLTLSIALLTLLILGGCSEDKDLKILELEKLVANQERTISTLIKDLSPEEIVAMCSSTKEEITTFGEYTLTETIQFDTDWDCHETVNVIPGAWWDEGVNLSVLKSPMKEITKTSYKLIVEDVGPFYHVSGYTGGMHCCEVHLFLSKRDPYEVVFEETGECCEAVQFSDFDNDGYPEMRIEDMHFTYWRGPFAGSAFPVIYLEYNSGAFSLDKDLMYSESIERIKNLEPDRIKFYPHENYGEGDGWQGHYIPYTLTEITSQLLIAGKEKEAKEFFNEVWPKNLTDKEVYWKIFKEHLVESTYWEY